MRPDATRPTGHVAKYYLYRAAMAAGFATPIWYYYVKVNVESYALVGVVDAIWWAGLVLFEIPTGVVGDRIGRRNSLLVASVAITVAQVAMAVSHKFVHFAVVFAFWAFASTFRSGTADAWLYDTLKARMDEDDFARVRGRGNAVMYVVMGATGVLGGYIAEAWMPAAYLASAAVTATSVPVLLSFPESTPGKETTPTPSDSLSWTRFQSSASGSRNRRSGRSFSTSVSSSGSTGASTSSSNRSASRRSACRSALSGGSTAGSRPSPPRSATGPTGFRRVVGIRRWFSVAPPLLGALFVVIALLPAAAIPVFLVMRGSRSVMMPLANQYINDRVESVGRATVLSTAGMVYNLVTVPFELGAGRLADALGIVPTIGLFGAILVVGSLAVLGVGSPLDAPTRSVEDAAD
ncbi:MFS transporter [Halorussus caseinilyticus]|uniref:MFS transporter n=1 Tax=Halorussus caseinilyticus TaxID=3034025 RepID=A0ABD5WPJ8_9EURY